MFNHFGKLLFFINDDGNFQCLQSNGGSCSSTYNYSKPLEEICEALEGFGGVSGRMETISSNPLVIVDFAHTPDGMEEVLKALMKRYYLCIWCRWR